MTTLSKAAGVSAAVIVTAAAALALHPHRDTANPPLPSSLVTAVQSNVVRSDEHADELSYSEGGPDPVKQLGAEALAQVTTGHHGPLPSEASVRRAVAADIKAGQSPVLLAESLALSARALNVDRAARWLPETSPATGTPRQWPLDQLRNEAAIAELTGNSGRLCQLTHTTIRADLLRGLLLWPLRGCVATDAEKAQIKRGYSGLGADASAVRSLAARYRISRDAETRELLRAQTDTLTSIVYPHYLTPDSADALVLIALSGVPVADTRGIRNYLFQQRMTKGALVDAGQEAGVSVGYAAALIREVLHRTPMLADAETTLRGAQTEADAAQAAYALASQGRRDPDLLALPGPAVAQGLRSYPGMIGLFLSGDCSAVAGALRTWSDAVRRDGMAEAVTTEPALAVLLSLDASAIRNCPDPNGAAADSLAAVDQLTTHAKSAGSAPGSSLAAMWAATRIACSHRDASGARRITQDAGFDADAAVSRASSTDDLFFILRLVEVGRGHCSGDPASLW